MANIQPTNGINIEQELNNLTLLKYHPNGIVNISLNRLTDMLDGKVEIVNPSNPLTYVLETGALNTAFAIQEYTLLTRKLYPRLANTEKDLYLHMSDYDYVGIFSEPAYGIVSFNILLNDFKDKATHDLVQEEYVLKLPRHLKISVDKYIFTLTSAIIIRMTESGVIDVKYENQDFNNVFPVETNYIDFNVIRVNQEETYIVFSIKLPEIDIEAIEIPLEKSKLFRNTLTYNPSRQFYLFKAFYMSNGSWKEMIVTHTDEVYDIYKPTCIVKVTSNTNSLEYYIPPVYINGNMIESKIKFLIYTTSGYIDTNFNDFEMSSFINEYNPVFPEIELDSYTEPLQLISKVIYLKDKVVGGKSAISFNELKDSVIENSIGDRQLPITNKQNEFSISQNNFRLIKDVDTVTNRIFLLETTIPRASSRYPITRINLGISEYNTTIANLKNNGNTIVDVNQFITLIPENTLFELKEEGLYLLTEQERLVIDTLSGVSLASEVNNHTYLSTLYHYVVDTTDNEIDLKAYDISSPIIKQTNFKEFNPTARVGINTINSAIRKVETGYRLDVMSNLKKYIGTITEVNVKPYLMYTDNNSSRFFLESSLFTTINNNPVYRFYIDTNYYIDKTNKLNITNFRDMNNNQANIYIDLDSKLELVYISNVIPANFTPSDMDNIIYGSYLAVGNCVVTLEELSITFGKYLEYLYTRVHTSVGNYDYEVYEDDVMLRYTHNVYNEDNEIIHYVNDLVLDGNDEPIVQYNKGDYVLDDNGNMIPISDLGLNRYINLLLIDYRVNLSTRKNIVDYKNYIKEYITEVVIENATKLQDQLLENTVGYVVVPKTIDTVAVKTPYRVVTMNCLQSFSIDVHVGTSVYEDLAIRDNIEYTIINELDNYLVSNTILSKIEILNILYDKLKEYVKNISIVKFTELEDDYMEIQDTNCRISLNKELIPEVDGFNIREDITISFIRV